MPQMSAQVFFVARSARNVLLAPLSAMTPVAGQADLYTTQVLENGRPVARQVRVGVRDRLRRGSALGVSRRAIVSVTGIRRVRAADGKFQW